MKHLFETLRIANDRIVVIWLNQVTLKILDRVSLGFALRIADNYNYSFFWRVNFRNRITDSPIQDSFASIHEMVVVEVDYFNDFPE